ncbi:HK97 family phage prohead protease [Microbacterium sp. NIBRBAC000506063]|uniref:HK97 family phage prohead protease n=1 Tax=Microbacterium sp. NIBRBAC000506063 TaxID=2734618 RepID=UPI001BB7EE40|nr:HK97 family phage prohead protease [Microbacterium sp. NIBRBAC000506063]QTV79479.1 HK97 family phage prohead protease [Microbacterium sp. NIBRBAC000506063]
MKAVGESDGLEDGTFEAIVSVFGNVDSYGDRVMKGAFEKTLEEWTASGNPIPVYYSHRMDDPDYNIGLVLDAKELAPGDKQLPEPLMELGGLWVRGQIDQHEEARKARQAYRLMKGRRLTQFSFAYDIVDYAVVKASADDEYVWELRELKLYEVGPTPIGANQETELLSVKSAAHHADRLAAGLKAGRVISAKNESELRTAYESIGRVLDALEPDEDSKASERAPAKTADDPDGAKAAEEPTRMSSARARQLIALESASESI